MPARSTNGSVLTTVSSSATRSLSDTTSSGLASPTFTAGDIAISSPPIASTSPLPAAISRTSSRDDSSIVSVKAAWSDPSPSPSVDATTSSSTGPSSS